jgi:peptide/nickel transport system substrate-binding protein
MANRNMVIGVVLIVVIAGAGVAYLVLNPPPPPAETTIILGTTFEIGRVLHPLTVHGGDDNMVFNTFEGLFQYRSDIDDVEPQLSVDFGSVSGDGLEYTFTLQQGVTFHDGTPFNASCVHAHFESMFTHGAGMTYYFTENLVNHTEVVDDYTIKFVLNDPRSDFIYTLGNIAGYIPSPTAIALYGIDNVNDHPVGTGPMKFVSRIADTEVVLEKNDDWWALDHGEEITVDTLIYTQIADAATLKLAIESGEIDCTDGRFNVADYDSLINNANLITYDQSSAASRRWLTFNMNSSLWDVFDNKTMRHAFAYAIPYEEIVSTPLQGYGELQDSILASEHPDYIPIAEYEYNATKSLELIAEAGHTTPVEVTLHITPSHYGTTEPDIAALIKERALPAGFDVTIEQEEYNAYKQRYKTTGEQEMNLWAWSSNPQMVWFRMFMASNTWGPGYSMAIDGDMAAIYPYVDDLIVEAGATTNTTRYSEICVELQELWWEWLPQIWLWREARFQFSRANIQGLVYGPQHYGYHLHNLIKT